MTSRGTRSRPGTTWRRDVALPSLAGVPRVATVTGPGDVRRRDHLRRHPGAGVDGRRRHAASTHRRPRRGLAPRDPVAAGALEVRAPLDETADAAPEPLRSVVQVFLRSGALEPLAVVRVRTAVQRLLDSRRVALADVHDDRVTAQTTALVGEEPAPRAWRTWEIRLAAGDLGLLTAASELVETAGRSPGVAGVHAPAGARGPRGRGGGAPRPRPRRLRDPGAPDAPRAPGARAARCRPAGAGGRAGRRAPDAGADPPAAEHPGRVPPAVRRRGDGPAARRAAAARRRARRGA